MAWMHFDIKDIVDILLVAVFLYQIYKLVRGTGSIVLFGGIILFIVIWILVSQVFELRLMGAILDKFISVGVVVLVILFQEEIRRFLFALGSHRGWKFVMRLLSGKNRTDSSGQHVAPIAIACMNMAHKKTGALIVVKRDMDLSVYEHSGERFDADVNARLIENIFFKNSPLHDGAMIIADNRIKAAGCILPVSLSVGIPKEYGLRHRSGLGMSMETDALVVIVSEERGKISVAHKGKFAVNVTAEELQQILSGERDVASFG